MPKGRQKVCSIEAIARAINEQPRGAVPGMVKKGCSQCLYWFALPTAEAEATLACKPLVSADRAAAIAAYERWLRSKSPRPT